MVATNPSINKEAFKKRPVPGKKKDEKIVDGITYRKNAAGDWVKINPQLEKQKQKSKEEKIAKNAATKAVKGLRNDYNGKAGLPRTNRA